MNTGEKIKALRKKHGLTLEEVGNAVGVGKSTVRKWETGMIANMRRDKIADLAKALHTTPAYLMGWEENSPQQISELIKAQAKNMDHQAPQSTADKNIGNLYALSLKEHEIIEAYRNKPEMQPAVDKLLNIYEDTNSVKVYRAAKSEESHPDEIVSISCERLQKLKDAPETDDIL